MDSSNINLLALVAKINTCRKTISDMSLTWTFPTGHGAGSAAFNNAIREGIKYKAQQQQAAGFQQFLEALRTGEYLPVVQEQVMAKTREELFTYRASTWTKQDDVNWARVYRELQRTTAIHGGLTEEEFRFYLTIVYRGKRVFFPYHVLYRSQVLEVGWSWDIIYSICCDMAETTTKFCNKHAVKAGLGEDLDGFNVMYELAAIMSQRIKEVKLQWPNASQEEIASRTTDRVSVGPIPHLLATSICHLVHVTATYYDFMNGDKKFDPESSFNRNIKELHPANGQSYEKDQETGKFNPGAFSPKAVNLYEYLAKSLSTYEGDEDQKKKDCDYSVVEMIWAQGSRQYSSEAIHLFAVAANGQATYHIPPNVLTCTYALNMGKGQWPVIVLPLMAEAARIHNDMAVVSFDTFKKRWRWVYDRLTNAMVLTKAFKMKNSHDGIFKEANTWSSEK
ncbi:unnamed protein product [Clonostachys chloroleuca]|uniref:Uncharacterized protein n=1 Tax=Clonostachys chloroleuca TaxID=1926264 RepID=A0AA35V9Z6_9HYPO|nr:unnamed protein product [Clonostachys chloroleuca]